MDAIRERLAVLSLRVLLAGVSATDRRTRLAYVHWQVQHTEWTGASAFDKRGPGGFTKLKNEAADENAKVRRSRRDPLADALAEAEALRAEAAERYEEVIRMDQPDPVPFAEAAKAVIAGPHAETVPPRQSH